MTIPRTFPFSRRKHVRPDYDTAVHGYHLEHVVLAWCEKKTITMLDELALSFFLAKREPIIIIITIFTYICIICKLALIQNSNCASTRETKETKKRGQRK